MTPNEIAMCKDALEAAGVPQWVIAKIVWYERTRSGTQRFGVKSVLPSSTGTLPKATVDREKSNLYRKLVLHLVNNDIADFRETERYGAIECSLELNVVPPTGWTPPNVH